VAAHQPTTAGKLDDLDTDAAALLGQLPGVAQVELAFAVPKPSHRIIHLRDWHYVPRDLSALDLRQAHGRELTEAEIAALHEELLLRVELVQLEQALLRCLARHHGLRRLLAEGMTAKDAPLYPARIAEFGGAKKHPRPPRVWGLAPASRSRGSSGGSSGGGRRSPERA